MGDSFTNILLIVLIGLIGYIGKAFDERLKSFSKKIEELLMSDVGAKKDVEQLKEKVEDHEVRIVHIERKIK